MFAFFYLHKMTYAKKLKSPRWLKRKYVIFERDKYTCQSCGSIEDQLHVHHKYYDFNKEPWDYPDEALVTYCEYCHNTYHLLGEQLQENLLEIIARNHLLIKPLAQLCILSEKDEDFIGRLKEFLNDQTVSYLQRRKTK